MTASRSCVILPSRTLTGAPPLGYDRKIMCADYLLSIDGGTESLRVGVCDARGNLIASAAAEYVTSLPHGGWAEQDPKDWWQALVKAAHRCLGIAGLKKTAITGISYDATTCTLLPLGRDGTELRPALLWMDVRAAAQADRIFATGHKVLRYCPSGCNAEWMLGKVLWIKEFEPEIYRNTTAFIEYTDWLTLQLTGRLILNRNTATQRWFYNCREWNFPTDLWKAVGVPDLEDKIPDQMIPSGAKAGNLTKQAAEALGLQEGTPVFQGAGDAFTALLGIGITESGQTGLIAGSSNVIVTLTENETHAEGLYGGFPDAIIPGLYLVEAGQASAGSILAWYKKQFLKDLPTGEAYATLDREAQKIPPGSGGLIVLDNFQGNRSPHSDSLARGAIWGLSLATGRAQLFRALMEGIAYGTHEILRVFSSCGLATDTIVACGGATKSDLYMQILSDVTGIEICTPEVPDAALLGGAILTARGLGIYPDFTSAAKVMVRQGKTYRPDDANHQAYKPYVDRHRLTYLRLKDLMHETVKESEIHT